MIPKKIMTALSLMAASMLSACGEVKSKITVVGEGGNPIQGAEVLFSYVNFKNEENRTVKTNENGIAESTGNAELRVNLRVSKEGYYETRYDKSQGTSLGKNENHDFNVVLRKIEHPVALHVKKVRTKIPQFGTSSGFDFEIGDWVSPHGSGERTDVLFTVSEITSKKNEYGGLLKVSFPQTEEGILKIDPKEGFIFTSEMKMPNEASEGEYQKFLERMEFSYHDESHDRKCGYFLKVRQTGNEKDEETFNYAKLNTDFKFHMGGGKYIREAWRKNSPTEYGMLEFTYYFNPTPNDRNLEFDPEKNLFKNLPHSEQVREP